MADTVRSAASILGYAELNYKGHDATLVPTRVTSQEFRDSFLSQWQFGSWVFSSTVTHASTGSTDIYALTTYSTAYGANCSSDITASSTAGTYTIGTAGHYLCLFDADITGSAGANVTFRLRETSTAGSTNQGAVCTVRALSTTAQHTGFHQIISVAAGNSVSISYQASTAASTCVVNGQFSIRRVR